MATHSSTLAWKISWTEESGRLQSMGSQRTGHNWACTWACVHVHTHAYTHKHTLISPILVSLIALVKWVEGSSVPVQSHHVPMQRCRVDDPDFIYFLRASCHTFSWGDQDHILWDCFLTRLLSWQTLTVPFFMEPGSFPWSTPESPWQGKRNLRTFVAGVLWEHERICECKSSSLQNHWVYFGVVLDLTSPTLVH